MLRPSFRLRTGFAHPTAEQILKWVTVHIFTQLFVQTFQRVSQRVALPGGIGPPLAAPGEKSKQQLFGIAQAHLREQCRHGLRFRQRRVAVQFAEQRLPGFLTQRGGLLHQLHAARRARIERRASQDLHEPAVKRADGDARLRQQELLIHAARTRQQSLDVRFRHGTLTQKLARLLVVFE